MTSVMPVVPFAGVAQLVEHHVANVVVVGSNPITRFVPSVGACRWVFVCNEHPLHGSDGVTSCPLNRSPPGRLVGGSFSF